MQTVVEGQDAVTYVDKAFFVDVSGVSGVVVAREPLEILGIKVVRVVVQRGQST